MKISIASRDIDFETYTDLSLNSPSGSSTWTAGINIEYQFSLKDDCSQLAFCNFLTQNYGNDSVYDLTGAVDNNGLDLSSNLSVVDLSEIGLDTQSIELHIDLPFIGKSLGVYLTVVGSYSLPPSSTVTVTGNLGFSGNETSFNGNDW